MSVKTAIPVEGSQVVALDSAASIIADVRRMAGDLHPAEAPTVEWRPLSALQSIAEEWDALASHALEPNVFYDHAFMTAAAHVFGAEAGAVLVWSQSSPRQLLGIFPARIERLRYGWPLAVLSGWTHAYGPLGTPLIDRCAADSTIAAWLAFVAGQPRLPGIMLIPLTPVTGPFAEALERALMRAQMPFMNFSRLTRALLDPPADRHGYLDRAIAHKKRRDMRRQMRQLGEHGEVKFMTATGRVEIAAALEDFLRLEAEGWKGRAGTAAGRHKGIRTFMHGAVAGAAASGKARIDRLTVGGRTIAAAITLMQGDTAWSWKIAYDEAYARYSPGILLLVELSDMLLADLVTTRVDSAATAHRSVLDQLWSERLELVDRLIAVRPQASFALACRLERLRRAAIASAKHLLRR